MYQEYYGLSEKPFNLTPDPRFLYLSKKHKEAFAHLMYGIQSRSGFVMVSGEIGTGKTTICRSLLKQLDSSIEVALIFNPYLSPVELLKHVNRDFGIESESTTVLGLIAELNTYLLKSATEGKTCVLIIDEAQNLSAEILEQIRLLSNLETEKEKLIQIMLIGQPELAEKLELHELRQLNQRITARYHLEALTEDETLHYVAFRLRVAGGRKMVRFTRKAIREIYKLSQGTPRVINAICDRALLIGFTLETREITPKIIKTAAHEIQGQGHIQRRTLNIVPILRTAGVLSFAAVIVLSMILVTSGPLPFLSTDTANYPTNTTTSPIQERNPGRDQQVGAITKTLSIQTIVTVKETEPEKTPEIEMPKEDPSPDATPPAPIEVASIPVEKTTPPAPEIEVPVPESTVGNLAALNNTLADLFAAWDVKPNSTPIKSTLAKDIRAFALAHNFSVAMIRSTPQGLLNINLPILIQIESNQELLWVAWSASDNSNAILSMNDGTKRTMSLDELRKIYTHRALIFWRDQHQYKNVLHAQEQGEAVWVIQHELISLGLREKEPNGVYDTETIEAVKRIQRLCGLEVDGVLGSQTRMVISSWVDTKNFPHLWNDDYPLSLPMALRDKEIVATEVQATQTSGETEETPSPADTPKDDTEAETAPSVTLEKNGTLELPETTRYTPLISPKQETTKKSVTEPARTLVPLRPVVEDESSEDPAV